MREYARVQPTLQSSVQHFDIVIVFDYKVQFCGALFKRILSWKECISKS